MSPPNDPTSSAAPRGFAARCAPALAAGLALATLAVFQADRASAAETAFLALWVTVALLPAGALAPAPGWEAALGAPLAVLAAWALPAGPARLAAVGVLLVAALGTAAGRAVARAREAALIAHLPVVLPLALGAQVLLRSELLLAPDARAVALLVVLPAVGGLALSRLAARAGLPAALIAGAAAVTLGPGFTAVTTLALLGVVGGAEVAAGIGGRERSRGALALAAAGLAAGLAFETRATLAALLAGCLLVLAASGRRDELARARESEEASRDRERRAGFRERMGGWDRPAARSVVVALALVLIGRPFALRSPPEAFALLSWVPLLLPALILTAVGPGRRAPGLAAAALAWASALTVPGPAAPAAALAVLALLAAAPRDAAAVGGTAGAEVPLIRRPVLAAQAVWSAALLGAAAVLASPPWLRPDPAAGGLALFGLAPGWQAAGAVLAAALALAAIGRSPVGRFLGRPAAWAGGGLILALLAALPAPGRAVFEGPAAVLRPERPRMAVELPGAPAGRVAIYTHLSNGLELPAGAEVASVALLDGEGRTVARRPLRAGLDTGEWAVRRPDVAALPSIESPPPWAVWIEGGGGAKGSHERPHFGQYYRALFELEPPVAAAPEVGAPRAAAGEPGAVDGGAEGGPGAAVELVVERAADLPAPVLVTIHRIEVAG